MKAAPKRGMKEKEMEKEMRERPHDAQHPPKNMGPGMMKKAPKKK